ncbi:DUF748 domain-containing protein [Thauera aromatica]|nr:DUF748 domain-containing protein [Thauera aromatica]
MSDTTTDSSAVPHRRSRGRRALWGMGAVLAVAAIAYLAVPPIARHYGQKLLADMLGREVRIDRVLVNPFRLSAEIGGLEVMESGGEGEALAFDSLRANFELESIVRRGPVLRELELVGPRLKLVLDQDGRHNWADVAARIAAVEGEERTAGDGRPLPFSIGNIRIRGGQITVEDRPRALTHELADIDLGVPFVSNLPVRVETFVQPSLSATLNGDPLLLSARTKPFAESQETVVDVVLEAFDLAPWLAYLPGEQRFRLPSALLSTNLELSFRQMPDAAPEVVLRGPVRVDKLVLQDRRGAPLAAAAEAELELADVQPLAGRWHFTRLRLVQPEFDIVRLQDGGLNVLDLLPPEPARRKTDEAGAAQEDGSAGAEAKASGSGADAGPPDFLLALARIRDGVIRFEDRSLATPFRTRIEAINLDVRDLATVSDLPAGIRLDYASDAGESFHHEGQLRLQPFELDGQLQFEALQLARYAPYLADVLPGAEVRTGRLGGSVHYRAARGAEGEPVFGFGAQALSLRDFALALKGSKDAAVKLPELDVREASVDLAGRKLAVAGIDVRGAAVSAVRQKDGEFDLMRLFAAAPGGSRNGAGKGAGKGAIKGGAAKPVAPEWTVAVDKLALQAASLRVEDRTVAKPVVTTVNDIQFELDGFSTAKGNSSRIKLDSRLNRRGRVGVSGALALEPLKADLRLDLRSVDLLPLQPYVLEQTSVAISRGSLTSQGRLTLRSGRRGQLLGAFRGDLGVAGFASVDRLNATDFVRWRTLRVGGIDARLEPFSLAIERVALDDFHTRLILDENGRLNLREIGAVRGEAPAGAAPSSAPAEPGSDGAVAGTGPAAAARSVELAPPASPPPPVRIERIEVTRGNVAFSDRFIQPNYDANLTDLAGALVGLSTAEDTIARLDLSGKVDKAAPLSITGELNPFRQDAHLDLLATVKDFELTGLSGYSGKYVGYGISRGKLSAELNYKIEDRRLTATNRIFLDQLTFGDKIDSPDAVNLPVQLAVSLLKNGRGEIDLRLPVSGTLDDPEFSVFGLVVKMLFNLIGKALTSPFALLGAALGGAEDLATLELAPGHARPGEAQQDKLATLAQALIDRPALRLDVTGRADPAVDSDGLRQAGLDRAVRAQKLKALIARGEEAPSIEEIEIGAGEYPELLKKAYREADFKKPRNLIGLAKDLPEAEMEALMRANVAVGDAELHALARQRAQAVRDWLVEEGKVPGERIFLLEPRVEPAGEGGQVKFSLR